MIGGEDASSGLMVTLHRIWAEEEVKGASVPAPAGSRLRSPVDARVVRRQSVCMRSCRSSAGA